MKKLTPQQYIDLSRNDSVGIRIKTINNEPFLPTHLAVITYPDDSVETYEYVASRNEWRQVSNLETMIEW